MWIRLGWLLLGTGLIVLLIRAGVGRLLDARALRGRRRDLLCGLALLVVAGTVLTTAAGAYLSGSRPALLLAAVIVAVGVQLFRPRWGPALLAIVLVALGLYGFDVVHSSYLAIGSYGFVPATWSHAIYDVLPQAYLFLIAGGVLGLQAADGGSAAGRVLLGRLAGLSRGEQLRALLLPLVVIMAAAAAEPRWMTSGWALSWSLLLLAAALAAARRRPEFAAALATMGLLVMGLVGLFMTANTGADGPALFGVLDVSGGTWPLLHAITTPVRLCVFAQSLLFLGGFAALAPRTIPGARRVLGTADLELMARVRRLTESRAVAVDTAAADLRRLERDLHDGAQARLVALGMQLRTVEKLIATSPEAAVALVAEARQTSAQALTELRELVRGVHPPVLADRGLADAIRALALDSSLRVDTEIDLPGRPPAPIETACYFAAAELLTNAAKHSGARDARVSAEHDGAMLRLSVTDFGLGGADAANGTGLSGIERRLAAFDGILAVSSPAGGPTTIVIEVPCALAPVALRS